MAALVQQLLRQNDLGGFLEHVDLKWFAYETRLGSFTGGKWRYDKMAGAACTAENMAKAGFVYTGTVLAADGVTTEPSAQCFVCQHEMVWDQATDHPMAEHKNHVPECALVQLLEQKPDQLDWTVRDYLFLMAYCYAAKNNTYADEMIANLETLQQKLIADCHAEVNAAAGAQGRQ